MATNSDHKESRFNMNVHDPVFNDHVCLLCAKPCANRRSLGNHLARSHFPDVKSIKLYVLKFFCENGSPPKCACGCGQEVAWHETQYRFNRYVNGHNEAGFCVKQIQFTQEQIAKRNASIKRAYADRPEIKKKISVAVLKHAAEDLTFSQKMSSLVRERWQRLEYRALMIASQKKNWAENYDARYARVFTEEFARKISAANARRDCKRTSKVEAEFVEKLRTFLPADDVEASKWFNFQERHVCVDAWSKSLNAVFELDGDYWHGLDRRSDFTREQLHNMAADLRKDLLFSAKSATVYRFTESDDRWRSADTLASFLGASRHCMVNGVTVKDGLFMFEDDDHPVLTRDALLKTPREQREKLLEPLVDFVTAYAEHRGFFYPTCDHDLRDELTHAADLKINAGSALLQSKFKSFWHVSKGPAESCLSERALTSVLAYRIGLNDSIMYEYELDGKKIQSNEMFDISPKQIRRGCVVQRKAVSWFKPAWAAHVWRSLLGDLERPAVWDPSAGFGARMFGFAATYPRGEYLANEPAAMTHADNENLASDLKKISPDLKITVTKAGSELWCPESESCDAVFTSPPFFDREKYFDEPGQCWRDHPTIETWVKGYVVPTLMSAERVLKIGGKLALHLPLDLVDVFADNVRENCVSMRRTPERDSELKMHADHFSRALGKTNSRREIIITWEKFV